MLSTAFGRWHLPETDIFPANGFIEVPREKMKNAAGPKVFLRTGVFP
jgi:hypothetical protein